MSNSIRIGIGTWRDDAFWVQINDAIYRRASECPVELIPIVRSSFFSALTVDERNALIEEIAAQELDVLLGWSFTEWGFVDQPKFIGLANYQKMFSDPVFWIALKVTATFTLLSVPLVILIALSTALLMTRKLRGMHIYRTLFYLPAVIGGVPMALIWTWVFNPDYGILNRLLNMAGLPGPNWLGNPQSALTAIVLVSAWNFGLPMVVFIAGLQNVPPVLYEAASLDGANAWRKLRFVTL